MKEFFRSTLATIVGVLVCGVLFAIVGITMMAGMLATSSTETVVRNNSVFVLDLKGTVSERCQSNPFDQLFSDKVSSRHGLDDILSSIRKAKESGKIKGIYLNAGALACSSASLQEIRDALADFKESGKFVVAYGDTYTQGSYYLASVADKVIVNPAGSLSWHGLAAESMFYKDLLAKVGVKMQVFRVGTYKSAVEPFIGTEMSPANREQTLAFISSIWGEMMDDVAESRKMSVDSLNLLADRNMDFQAAEAYVECGLADTLMYKDEVLAYLKSLAGAEEDERLATLTLDDMINVAADKPKNKSGNIIAVYYAYGEIDNGMSSSYDEGINSEKVIKDLRDLREDEHVKAVVLRVNSPGGSAYGSEQIWREVSLLKEEKPVVVSMGDYAASGGYYISCAASKIVAEPATLTGSIGIFGIIPDAQGLAQKIGIGQDVVKTNGYSDFGNLMRPMTDSEKALMQAYVERGYDLFLSRVAQGRGMTKEAVDQVAQGRVWTGARAKELGLVDELGGLERAVEMAADKAGLDTYTRMEYPAKKSAWQQLKELNPVGYVKARLQQGITGRLLRLTETPARFDTREALQARMEFELR